VSVKTQDVSVPKFHLPPLRHKHKLYLVCTCRTQILLIGLGKSAISWSPCLTESQQWHLETAIWLNDTKTTLQLTKHSAYTDTIAITVWLSTHSPKQRPNGACNDSAYGAMLAAKLHEHPGKCSKRKGETGQRHSGRQNPGNCCINKGNSGRLCVCDTAEARIRPLLHSTVQ
jgi:hypothetical protein